MSNKIHCDVCDHSVEWNWQKLEGWQSVRTAISQVAFAKQEAEKHICPKCWEFLHNHYNELMQP